jgi:hypothetical protein
MLLNTLAYGISAVPPVASLTEFNVTVASGAVASDLTGFPLMVDLSDMPPGFWSDVRTDGGNIRAYADDGTTLLPHDVTYISADEKQGRMFIRADLLAASDNLFVIKILSSGTTGLAPGDSAGQYAVWSDFEVVVVFPDLKNRFNDAAPSGGGTNIGTFDWKENAQQSYTAHQGVAFDGTFHYAADTNYLRKYSTGLTVVASNADPCGDMNTATGETTLNHVGSPTIIDGQLWAPIEVYPASPYERQYVGKWSLADLSFIGYIQLSGATRESSALIEDAALNRIYVTDFTNGATIPYFNKATGTYVGALSLSETLSGIQGIADMGGGQWIVSCNSYPRGPVYVQSDGTVGGYVFEEWYSGTIEGVSYHAPSGAITFDNGNIRDYVKLARNFDYARLHSGQQYWTTPRSDTWTMVASAWFTPSLSTNEGVVALNNNGDSSTATRTGAGYRNAGALVAAWNTNDSWVNSSPVVAVTTYQYNPAHRIGLSHEGTTQRRLFADGAITTDAGVAAKPGAGTNMDFAIGANNAAGTDPFYGYVQFAWLRKEAMSNAWMAADSANNRSPATFYSIAEA